MASTSKHPCVDDDVDDRTIVLRTMRSLENSVYKRPRGQSMPEIFRGLWRRQIVEWMYVLIKYCKLNHEATAAAVYFLDAAVMCNSASLVKTPRDYQLCAMTALHLALKVYDSPAMRVVKLSCLVKLGNGEFTEEDIIQKEIDLVRALGWRVNPPTADCFLQRYMELLPFLDDDDDDDDVTECEIDSNMGSESDVSNICADCEHDDQLQPTHRRRLQRLRKLEEVAVEFIEVAMARDRFLAASPSVIAYAAMLSAMELTSQHKQHQRQQCYYDWSTFLHNMTEIAEMGDICSNDGEENLTNDCDGSKAKAIITSRSVRRTKMLMDRIVQGLDLPPEEEDDFYFGVESGGNRMSGNDTTDGDDNSNKENKIGDNFDKFSQPTAARTSSPQSPTSTVSTHNTESVH